MDCVAGESWSCSCKMHDTTGCWFPYKNRSAILIAESVSYSHFMLWRNGHEPGEVTPEP